VYFNSLTATTSFSTGGNYPQLCSTDLCVCARMYEQTWSLVLRHSFTATMKHNEQNEEHDFIYPSVTRIPNGADIVYRAPFRKSSASIVKKATQKSKLHYDRKSVSLGVKHPSGIRDQFLFLIEIFFRRLRICYFVAPSLTRGRVL
jgi:hypothetical protein